MIEKNKLYLGVWDNKDQDGKESEVGGIIHGKERDGNPKIHGLLFKIKVLNDSENFNGTISAYNNAIDELGIYPVDDNKYELANNLKKYVFLFKINDDDPNNLYVYDIKKLPRYNKISSKYQVVPIIYMDNNIKDIDELNRFIENEEAIEYWSAEKLGSSEDSNGFLIFKDSVSNNNFLFENANLKEVTPTHIRYGLFDSENNDITIRKINNSQWSDGKYFDDDDKPTLVFIPEEDLMVGNIDVYAPKYNENISNNVNEAPIVANQSVDLTIINNFNKVTKSKKFNLSYSDADLINFHISVKTNLLTILSGISGTGKSKIVKAYAEAMGINNDRQFKIIPVRPFWQDDSDLLGYVDTMSNNYHPADSGLVDTLLQAESNPNDLYIILLDEMNLAKIEHYFSQFLSILELDPNDRKLRLYNSSLEPRLYNSFRYKSEINLGNNIRFVGTMNIDESTFQMSNKLLDRANIITLDTQKFTERNLDAKDIDYENLKKNKITAKEYEVSINKKKLNYEQLDFFWNLHKLINTSLPDVGIGWRTLNSIERFINNVPVLETKFDALDYQLAERIFPRIRGTENMLNKLLRLEHDKNEGEVLGGSIVDLLNENWKISSFSKSKNILNKKAREIETYGFAR